MVILTLPTRTLGIEGTFASRRTSLRRAQGRSPSSKSMKRTKHHQHVCLTQLAAALTLSKCFCRHRMTTCCRSPQSKISRTRNGLHSSSESRPSTRHWSERPLPRCCLRMKPIRRVVARCLPRSSFAEELPEQSETFFRHRHDVRRANTPRHLCLTRETARLARTDV
jgi:hypothetical protein